MDLKAFSQKRICVACSGGVDSVALLHYLKAQETRCGFLLSAVHCQHGIRGEESLADMRFVQALCGEWNVPLHVFEEDCLKRAEVEKCSVETAARNFRKTAFARLIAEDKADYIATAHHVSDEAETVLFRIARGTSLSGARGMQAQEGRLIRPFLDWTKEHILSYAEQNGLTYCEDATNQQTEYTRNKLRLEVFPILEKAVPGAKENFARFAALAAEDDAFLYAESEKLLTECDGKTLLAFCDKKPLFCRACLTAMKKLGVEKDYTAAHLDSVYALQNKERGAKIDLPRGVVSQKTKDGIVFYLTEEREILPPLPNVQKPFDERGFDGGRYEVKCSKEQTVSENEWAVLRLDRDKLPSGAVFRFRRDGDEIRKFGGGTKTLKKFFNEKKLPVEERAYLPLIASAETNEVYAVCGVEIADGVKVDEHTKNTLYISLFKKRNG